jgi:hypothetical protein
MVNSAERKANEKAERAARERAAERAEQAQIVEGLYQTLEPGESLLAFARGRIAGGWRGKLNVGLEAFFAPFVNIGLTERRFILQHIHPESGRPSEILPHVFPLSEIVGVSFSDIETFGSDPAGRLTLRLPSDQHVRLRLLGRANFESAQALAEVFRSLTETQAKAPASPTQTLCSNCAQALDRPSKFCPYCGTRLAAPETPAQTSSAEAVVSPTSPTEQPAFTEASPVSEVASSETPPSTETPPAAEAAEPVGIGFVEFTETAHSEALTAAAETDTLLEAPVEVEPEAISPVETVELEASVTESAAEALETLLAREFAHVEATEPPSVSDESAEVAPDEAAAMETISNEAIELPATPPSFAEAIAAVVEILPTPELPEPEPSAPELPETSSELATETPPDMLETTPENYSGPAADAVLDIAPDLPGQTAEPTAPEVYPDAVEFSSNTALNKTIKMPAMPYFASEPAPPEPPRESPPSAPEEPEYAGSAFSTPPPPAAPNPIISPPLTPTSESRPLDLPGLPSEELEEERFSALLNEILGAGPRQEPPRAPSLLRVHLRINEPPLVLDETFTGANAEEVVGMVKEYTLRKMPLPLRFMYGKMSNLDSARELVRRYNQTRKKNLPLPNSCEEFLSMVEQMGYGRIERG